MTPATRIPADVRAYITATVEWMTTGEIIAAVEKARGITVSRHIVKGIRRRVKTAAEAGVCKSRPTLQADELRNSSQDGCLELLRRHLVTGCHWISDPARFEAAARSAGLAA